VLVRALELRARHAEAAGDRQRIERLLRGSVPVYDLERSAGFTPFTRQREAA
jgi:hypothetical protein